MLVGSEDVDGVFTPGELLKIALAACSGMSSDQPLARRLGDDYQAVVRVSGAADRDQERYPLLEETLELDLSGLSDDEKERLLVVVNRAIDLVCTVGRTLKSGTTVNFEVADVGPRRILTSGSPPGCTGMVQGVGFRWWTRCRALELGLTGYAANQRRRPGAGGRPGARARRARNCCSCCEGGAAGPGRQGRRRLVAADEQFDGFVER